MLPLMFLKGNPAPYSEAYEKTETTSDEPFNDLPGIGECFMTIQGSI